MMRRLAWLSDFAAEFFTREVFAAKVFAVSVLVAGFFPAPLLAQAPPKGEASAGKALYLRHCAACHGEQGDGRGVAATFLYPKPRTFRDGKYRLVSTEGNAPTRDDLHAVLLRGMPGSSMPGWGHLSVEERNLLVDEVLRLTKEGAKAKYIRVLKEQEELTDDEIKSPETQAEIEAFGQRSLAPGNPVEIPPLPPADAAAIVRGKAIYTRQGCHSCHGAEGKGDGVKEMFDDEGFATKARDLTKGIYKGAADPATLYMRLRRGMPGTPMPSSQNLPVAEITDLVHYLRSMSTEEQREAVVLKRGTVVARRIATLPAESHDAAWNGVPATSIATFPLWWRDDALMGLKVQAAHDGEAIAVRLTWSDPSPDGGSSRPEDFEDMAAVQLAQAGQEPFLGMGAADAPLEVWQWRHRETKQILADSLLDDYPLDTEIYKQIFKDKPLPDLQTARAAGNPLAARSEAGSFLAAKGPGSLTFAPAPSQKVAAAGVQKEKQWQVVFRRPLKIEPAAGIPLAPAGKGAIAIAVWDGAARDRGGQKAISIWHDLKLEP